MESEFRIHLSQDMDELKDPSINPKPQGPAPATGVFIVRTLEPDRSGKGKNISRDFLILNEGV